MATIILNADHHTSKPCQCGCGRTVHRNGMSLGDWRLRQYAAVCQKRLRAKERRRERSAMPVAGPHVVSDGRVFHPVLMEFLYGPLPESPGVDRFDI